MSRIVTNLTNQRVNVSDSTTLECEVTGTPTPTVVWTKDNQTVMEGSGAQNKTSVDLQKNYRCKNKQPSLYPKYCPEEWDNFLMAGIHYMVFTQNFCPNLQCYYNAI